MHVPMKRQFGELVMSCSTYCLVNYNHLCGKVSAWRLVGCGWVQSLPGLDKKKMIPLPPCLALRVQGWNWGSDHPMIPGCDTAAAHHTLRWRANAEDRYCILQDVAITRVSTFQHHPLGMWGKKLIWIHVHVVRFRFSCPRSWQSVCAFRAAVGIAISSALLCFFFQLKSRGKPNKPSCQKNSSPSGSHWVLKHRGAKTTSICRPMLTNGTAIALVSGLFFVWASSYPCELDRKPLKETWEMSVTNKQGKSKKEPEMSCCQVRMNSVKLILEVEKLRELSAWK